jgi:CHAD domain-containing protein
MARSSTRRDDDHAAAGRTLVGAAAAGTTATGDPPPAPKPASRAERTFRLRADETTADGIRRVVRGQLADGADELSGVTEAELGTAVHRTRKSIKRVRAALRLSRGAIGEDAYQRENTHMRMIAGRLSGVRDARVMIDTLTALERRFEDELPPFATTGLRDRLEDEHRRAIAAIADEGDVVETTVQALAEARARTAQWHFDVDDFGAVESGLRRIYRRGRNEMRAARAQPGDERLHDCRKRVKDLWHATQLLRPAHPKRMRRLSRDVHSLADLLGDHHDLSVLRDYVEVHPQLFDGAASRDALLAVIDRRRDALRASALKLGRRVYKRPPKRFARAVERGWRKRVGTAARPLAG